MNGSSLKEESKMKEERNVENNQRNVGKDSGNFCFVLILLLHTTTVPLQNLAVAGAGCN